MTVIGTVLLDKTMASFKGTGAANLLALSCLSNFPNNKNAKIQDFIAMAVLSFLQILVAHIQNKIKMIFLKYLTTLTEKNCLKLTQVSTRHCVKSVQIQSYFWSVFSCIRTEYRKIRTRNNSVFGHFSCSENLLKPNLGCFWQFPYVHTIN